MSEPRFGSRPNSAVVVCDHYAYDDQRCLRCGAPRLDRGEQTVAQADEYVRAAERLADAATYVLAEFAWVGLRSPDAISARDELEEALQRFERVKAK